MARAYGSQAQMALALETTYGTAPASGFIAMPFASTTLGAEQPLIASELLGYGRDPLAPSRDVVTVDGRIVVPVDATAIGWWLKGLLGEPTTTGTSPKTHTYVSGASSLPSLSIEIGNPEVPYFDMFTGCVVDSMQFRMERSGNLQATVQLIAQGSTPDTETNAGTPTAVTLQRFGHFNGAIERDGSALGSIVSAEFTYSNNLDAVQTIRADGLIDGVDPTMAALTGTITARFDSTTLLDQAIAGTPCELEFSWVISSSLSLTITAHSVYLPRPRREITGAGGVQVTFDFQGAKDTSPARMMTAVLVNSQADY